MDGEFVLLNLNTGIYFGLNRMGTCVWQAVKVHGDPEQVIATVQTRYSNVAVDTIRKDICDLIDQLRARGLLEAESLACPA